MAARGTLLALLTPQEFAVSTGSGGAQSNSRWTRQLLDGAPAQQRWFERNVAAFYASGGDLLALLRSETARVAAKRRDDAARDATDAAAATWAPLFWKTVLAAAVDARRDPGTLSPVVLWSGARVRAPADGAAFLARVRDAVASARVKVRNVLIRVETRQYGPFAAAEGPFTVVVPFVALVGYDEATVRRYAAAVAAEEGAAAAAPANTPQPQPQPRSVAEVVGVDTT
jgi:hypothetical protein